jgi:LPXTG-motif cell wall-anchored protein
MQYNTIYCIREVTAPDGYVRETTPVYVALDNENQEYPEEVQVVRNQEEYTYYATNKKGQIEVDKQFQSSDGADITKLVAGTYIFALYEDGQIVSDALQPSSNGQQEYSDGSQDFSDVQQAPSGEPLQILTIQYSQDGTITYHLQQTALGTTQQVAQPRFINLDLNKHYSVYELTSKVTELNGVLYQVIYENNTGIAPSDVSDKTTTVKIINQAVTTYALPQTGGSGSGIYKTLGVLLTIMAALTYTILKRLQKC